MSLSERRLTEARAKGQKALSLAGTLYQDTAIRAQLVLSTTQVYSGAAREGRKSSEEALALAVRAGDQWLVSRSTLVLAETMLESGDAPSALTTAFRAQENFARTGDQESEWRAWLIAARASQRTGDQTKAREYASHAAELLANLEQKWGTEAFNGYLARPDIKDSHKRLGEITVEAKQTSP
ncbi:MAG: hypothetical protein H0W99_01735 [Acidobacteria bacterium]|nr:hypothetical protein [Acidobacteriota bacterium]